MEYGQCLCGGSPLASPVAMPNRRIGLPRRRRGVDSVCLRPGQPLIQPGARPSSEVGCRWPGGKLSSRRDGSRGIRLAYGEVEVHMITMNLLKLWAGPHRLLPRFVWLLHGRPEPHRWRQLRRVWGLAPSAPPAGDHRIVSLGRIKPRTLARLKRDDLDRAA